MTVHAIEQAVKLQYVSQSFPHVMILPINTIAALGTDETDTTVEAWDSSTINLGDMVAELVETFTAFYPNTAAFQIATLLVTDEDDDVLVPAFSWPIAGGGGDALTPGWVTAVQWTITFRSADNNIAKIDLMDSASFDNFSLITNLAGETALEAIIDAYTAVTNGWAARDNSRPATWLQASRTLNEKLRRAHRLT